ncbi:MAG: pinensin family lanthipeptide [Cyclobacteriaceae bacterium]
MKKKNLRLDELKVKSFVTVADDKSSETVKAGLGRNELRPYDTYLPTPQTYCFVCDVTL